jgi:hypothetical protein
MRKFFKLAVNFPILIIAIFFTLTGCQREIDSPLPGGNTGNNNQVITAGVRGVVIDNNNQPVAGATVTSGTFTTTTDSYGIFYLKNITLNKANGYIKIVKPGFFTGNKSFVPTAGRIHNVRIRLAPKINTGSFDAATGGTVSLTSGAKVVLPAAAITDVSGNPYTGTVNIAMTWIDPTAPNLQELVQGDLRGINTSGQEVGLETFGMIGVEMTGAGNVPLKIATGKTAQLSFPLPTSISGNAPATIDLWHFDETTGSWKQEGTATKTGSFYVGTVSHFSFWNCDAGFPVINLCMTLVNSNNNNVPLNNVLVRIYRPNGSYGFGWTDSAGNICGKVPMNEPLVLKVMDYCNNPTTVQNIGPFSTDTNLGTIQVNLLSSATLIVTGNLTNCSGANITNGAAVILVSGLYQYVAPVTNGSFSATLLNCAGTVDFTVTGVDYSTLQAGVMVSGSGVSGILNMGNVAACGSSSVQYAQYIIDGNIYNFMNPPDAVVFNDTTGIAPAPLTNTSYFRFSNFSQGIQRSAELNFHHNQSTGTFPLQSATFQVSPMNAFFQFANPTRVVNITAFGPVGGYIEGNWSEPMVFSTAPNVFVNKVVTSHFRIKRL